MSVMTELLKKLGVELSADQTKQVEEVLAKSYVPAEDAAKATTELDNIKGQLTAANDTIKAFGDLKPEDVKTKLADWEKKYADDTKALQDKLTAQETDFATEKFFGGYKFANDRVKNSVINDFKAQGFKLKDGAFVGGAEFMDSLKTSEPDIFASETPGLFMGATQSQNTERDPIADMRSAMGLENK